MTRRILFVDHAAGLGGAERSLLLLLRALDQTRIKPHLATVEGDLAAEARHLGVPVHIVPLPRLRNPLRFFLDWHIGSWGLVHVARAIEADALYANTVRAAMFAAPAGRIARRPFIWHMRDFWLSESRPRFTWADTLIKRALCATARLVIANSHATAAHLPCANTAQVVYNGLAADAFAQDPAWRETFRRQHNIPPNAPLVGMVGRLRPWKGAHRFVEIAAHVHAHRPDVHFVIVGGTPLTRDMEYPRFVRARVAEQGLTRFIHFTGHLTDVRPALAAMDIFVHPGDPEPFGMVVLEAMAAGKPVVAFAHGALPELVEHEQTGILVPPTESSAAANAILALLEQPERAHALGVAGRERARNTFSIETTATRIATLLEEATGAHR